MFKKMLSVLLVVLMLLSASVTFVSADETDDALADLILGDTDCDAEVNVKDATAIQKFLAGLSELTEEKILCADADYNGIVNIKDATVIQKYLADYSPLPEGKFINISLYVVDLKLQLKELIEYGRELTSYKDFEAKSYVIYLDADTDAYNVFEDNEAVPSEILNAYTNLDQAIKDLLNEERILALEELYDALNSIPVGGNYTSESFGRLCEAIEEGWVIYENPDATIEEIRQQTEKIMDAHDKLESPPISEDALNTLWAAIMDAEDIWEHQDEYTPESLEVFDEALYDARMTYYYGDSDEEYWFAIQRLNDAVDNLVIKLPEVLPTIGEIDFVNEYEYRVGPYNYNWDNVNVIVRSPEELQAEIDKIDVDAYDRNEDIFPEKYDDAFFKENAIIMSFCLVGGSGCSQWVYSLEIDGTALIVRRSVNRPEIYPPDMNYSLSYLEVKKADIAGVTMTINEINGEFDSSNEC